MTKKFRQTSMIDMNIMHSIFGNNRSAMNEYINDFIVNISDLLKKIEHAIQDENVKLTMEYFHRLKGPAGSSGFIKIYKLCEKAEETVLQSDWSHAKEICFDIEKILKQIQKELVEKN